MSVQGERVSNGFQLFAQLTSKEFKTDEKKKQELEKQNKIKELREKREEIRKQMTSFMYPLKNQLALNAIDMHLFELEGCYRISEEEWNQIEKAHFKILYYNDYSLSRGNKYCIEASVLLAFNIYKHQVAREYVRQQSILWEKTDKIGVFLISVPKLLDLETVKRCAEVVRPVTCIFEYEHLAG